MLKLFNTLGREVQEFRPIGKIVGIYTCGPTVYNFAHIGNLRSYLFEDVLKRTLLYNNFKVKHVMNITDVGHLTSDADEGEDKMLKGAKREGKTVWEIAEFYTKSFMSDIEKLNIIKADVVCKATDHIKEMIELVKKLEKNGYTYNAGGNVYFDVSKFKDYGKMARLNLEELKSGARVDVDINKRNPQDFVLWFTKSKFADQEMKWDSPFGTGYPGWHIECSAMSMKYLGEQFDIHCGGIDHVPVHHTNEIAQSEAATGKKWVNYWVHNEFLNIVGAKMAKSGENFITLQVLIDKGYDPLDYRYLCIGAHYRTQLQFTYESLDNAKNSLKKLREKIIEIKESKEKADPKKIEEYKEQFKGLINEDLDTTKALAFLWAVLRSDELNNKEKYELALDFDKVLGLNLDKVVGNIEKLPAEIEKLVAERDSARKAKDWKKSDELRNYLVTSGYAVLDTPEGTKLRKNI